MVADGEGRHLARRRRPTAPSGDAKADVAALVDDVRALLLEADIRREQVARIGLSVPGPIDRERGCLIAPPNLPGWHEVPLRDWIEDALGVPVRLENDANAAAMAEWRFGAGRGATDLVYLTMSTGVGGGLILGGRLVSGHRGNAGEFGHVPIERDGEPCLCGQRGCLEAYVGGAAWTLRLRAQTPVDSAVATLAGGREHATPDHVVAAAGQGDPFALRELDRFNDYLARGIANAVYAVAPEIVVLGTIPTAAGEALCLDPVRERVRGLLWPVLAQDLRIVPSELGEELPYYAGASVALDDSATGASGS